MGRMEGLFKQTEGRMVVRNVLRGWPENWEEAWQGVKRLVTVLK